MVFDENNSDDMVSICKIIGQFNNKPSSFNPHTYSYKIISTDIYLAPSQPLEIKIEEENLSPPE